MPLYATTIVPGAASAQRNGRMSTMPTAIDKVVITPRTLYDYRNMFLLTEDDLVAGPILDCPAGASPFGAQVRARGGTVISADMAYGLPLDELTGKIRADLHRLTGWMDANHDMINWAYLGSPDALMSQWEVAVDYFLADFTAGGERYVTATLPTLPFPDKHFRLVLSSHMLFTFPQFVSFEEHLASLLELVRVSNGETRVFPIVDTTNTIYPQLDELHATLLERGIHTEIRTAACAYNKGADQMLALWSGGLET
jgi:hypothetical protein